VDDGNPSAGDVLQVAATVAGIALALAALTKDDGPTIRDYRVLPVSFLIVGLLAIVGSHYAMKELLWDVGISPWAIRPSRPLHERGIPPNKLEFALPLLGLHCAPLF
jgi:hypothetical protein